MSVFVSYVFEKDQLTTAPTLRVITRNRDDGGVPPSPTTSYFPTLPNELREFLVLKYLDDNLGETYERIATLSDITGYPVLQLNTFEDTTTNFSTAGVGFADILEVSLLDPEPWVSSEYPSGNPFQFSVLSVVSATKILLATPFPVFAKDLTWSIPLRGISGIQGITRRTGSPAPGTTFRAGRYNRRFLTAVDGENYVVAAKAAILSLVNESMGSTLIDETGTVSSTL